MTHDSARGWFTAVLAISFLTGFGCSSDGDGPSSSSDDHGKGPSSRIDASGRVCTRGADGVEPECWPAECIVSDRCLRCVDPRGRVGFDCSIDYSKLAGGGSTARPSGSDSMASCSFIWGVGNASGTTTCHYPGTTTCVINEQPDWHCLSCRYADGSASGNCRSISEPLPDPLMGRPDDLPPPGSCVFETGEDGLVSCATCTRDDLSAERSCQYPGVIACDGDIDAEDRDAGCSASCTLEDGSDARLCNSPRGPRPVASSAP